MARARFTTHVRYYVIVLNNNNHSFDKTLLNILFAFHNCTIEFENNNKTNSKIFCRTQIRTFFASNSIGVVGTMGSSSHTFLELLDQQYSKVEDYANAQTLLYNASTTAKNANANGSSLGSFDDDEEEESSSSPIIRALERLEDAKWNLRSNLENLREAGLSKMHSRHLELSRRVITTISTNPSWHANGLPNDAGRNSFSRKALEANTVAIAALNASIARIRDIEGSDAL